VTKSSLTNISIEDGRAFDLIRVRTGYTGHINTPTVHLHPSTLATFSDTESKSSLIITAVRFVTLTRPVTHRSINVPTRRVSSRMLRWSVLISYGITKPLLGKVGFLSTCCRVQRPASHMWQRSGKSFLWNFLLTDLLTRRWSLGGFLFASSMKFFGDSFCVLPTFC